jgi:prophage antirepressor-like protein
MIKLFEFQENAVRTEIVNSEVWFNGKDIYDVLSMTWRGGNGLRNEKKIPEKWIMERGVETSGGLQSSIFISEHALYKIAFGSKPKKIEVANKLELFTQWVAELLVKLRKGETMLVDAENEDIKKHLDVSVQKGYSKKVNSLNFSNGGLTGTIDYNRKNCQLHTNKQPHEVVKIGKDFGLKSKQRTSAKEVIRNLKPELACSMSFTDKLVSENGIVHEVAAKTSLELAQPLFKKLMELGIKQKSLQ